MRFYILSLFVLSWFCIHYWDPPRPRCQAAHLAMHILTTCPSLLTTPFAHFSALIRPYNRFWGRVLTHIGPYRKSLQHQI